MYKGLKRYLFPQTLQVRFVLIIILPILLGQSIAVYLFYQRHWYNVINHNSRFIVKEISALLATGEYTKISDTKRSYINLEYKFIKNIPAPKRQYQQIEEIRIFQDILKRITGTKGSIIMEGTANILLHLPVEGGTLIIYLPYKSILNPTTYIFVLWIFFLTILLLTVSLIFSKNQIKSIIGLTRAAQQYGRGIKANYKPSGAQEIRQAGLSFLKMRDKIERQTAKRTQMLAMISHDLKTPLARMRLQVELMDKSEEKEELLYDISSMQHMIACYLDFARGEGGEQFQAVDIGSWMLGFIKNKWYNTNISVSADTNSAIVNIKPYAFDRAITNIVDNALNYSKVVEVSIYHDIANVIILVEDNGRGIRKEDRELVFTPFYRADQSRPLDNTPSVGLGLTITQEIISGHHGSIALEDSKKLKGLLVRITLPIKV